MNTVSQAFEQNPQVGMTAVAGIPAPAIPRAPSAPDGGMASLWRKLSGRLAQATPASRQRVAVASPLLSHFGLRELPFDMEPVAERHFPTVHTTRLLGLMEQALLNNGGLIKLVGPTGSGKTLLKNALVEQLQQRADRPVAIAEVTAENGQSSALVDAVCRAFGVDMTSAAASGPRPLDRLGDYLVASQNMGRHCILIIDNAQMLGISGIETAHLMAALENDNGRLLHVLLIGQSAVDAMLASKTMGAIRRSITFSFNTVPFTAEETQAYLDSRIGAVREDGQASAVFAPSAMALLPQASRGVPGLVNQLSQKSLEVAHSHHAPAVEAGHVLEAAAGIPSLAGFQPPKKSHHTLITWASGAVGAVAGAAIAASLLLATPMGERLRDVLNPQVVAALVPPPVSLPAQPLSPVPDNGDTAVSAQPVAVAPVNGPVAAPVVSSEAVPVAAAPAGGAPDKAPASETPVASTTVESVAHKQETTPPREQAEDVAVKAPARTSLAREQVMLAKPAAPALTVSPEPAVSPAAVAEPAPAPAPAPVVAVLPVDKPAAVAQTAVAPLAPAQAQAQALALAPTQAVVSLGKPVPPQVAVKPAREQDGRQGAAHPASQAHTLPLAVADTPVAKPVAGKIQPPAATSQRLPPAPTGPPASVASPVAAPPVPDNVPATAPQARRGHLGEDGRWVWN